MKKQGLPLLLIAMGAALQGLHAQRLVRSDDGMTIRDNGRERLTYRSGMHYPPKGVDTVFRRSGFLHPVYAPHGQVLTWINAPDHYHHYGIWNPWTHIEWKGGMYDLWNLGSQLGTVRFAGYGRSSDKASHTRFSYVHEHVAFEKSAAGKRETVILRELQTLTYRPPAAGNDHYVLDLEIRYEVVGDSAVTLKEYRYGGLGWRCTPEWNRGNSFVLTSEGLDRKKADGSLARWVAVEGKLGEERGGMVWFSHPANFNHPEPLRIWPEEMNGRGDLFVNFSPTKNRDWKLLPGGKHTLRYRMYVYNGAMPSRAAIDDMWAGFAR